jgi:hypothetical protein
MYLPGFLLLNRQKSNSVLKREIAARDAEEEQLQRDDEIANIAAFTAVNWEAIGNSIIMPFY